MTPEELDDFRPNLFNGYNNYNTPISMNTMITSQIKVSRLTIKTGFKLILLSLQVFEIAL